MGKLFVDMDGVLADFNVHHETHFGEHPSKVKDNVDWAAIRAIPDFFYNIPPMPDAPELWAAVRQFNPIILTGIPDSVEEAADNKRRWVSRHLGGEVEVRCCRSAEKYQHAAPGDILIDDWEKYRHRWERAGGIWITHRSAAESIDWLKKIIAVYGAPTNLKER